MRKVHITNRARNLIVIILALSYLSFCIWSIITTEPWINRPFPGFLVMKNNFVPILWLPQWEGAKQGIKTGDIIIAVNNQPVTRSDEIDHIIARAKPGTLMTYTVMRGKQKLQFKIPVSIFSLKDYLLLGPTFMAFGLFFYLMGLVVFYLKPNNPASWTFLLAGVMPALGMASTFEYCITHLNYLPIFAVPLTGTSILLISLYFPNEIKSRKYFIYFLAITTMPLLFFYLYFFSKINIFRYIDTIAIGYLIVTSALGLSIMIRSFIIYSDKITRQKAKIVIYGFMVGFLCSILAISGVIILKIMSVYWLIGFAIPISMIPLSIGYAIVKHNLFDIDILIRRSASYLLVSGIIVVLFFALIALFSLALQKITGQSSQIAAVLSTMLMVLVFRPLRDRVDRVVDRRFFREKYEYRQTIQKASEVLVSIIDLNQLLHQLLDTILGAIKIERGGILLRKNNPDRFEVSIGRGYEASYTLAPLEPEHPILHHLFSRKRAIQINDVQEMEEFQQDREFLLNLMNRLSIVLVIPIFYKQGLIGILGLGAKKSGAWYSSEDIDLLQTLMNQTAISIDNARKVEELRKMVELETSYRELKQIDEMKDNFLSMVSHDLRTPMTSIQGYASVLMEKLERLEPERQKRYLGIIINESQRLTRLINNLLDLQRFEAGRMPMQLVNLDLAKIVRPLVDSFQGAALAKKQTLEALLPEGEIRVKGDADRLSQLLANLLSNAGKFTPEGGRILVTLEKILQEKKTLARVTVKDNGPGIPPELQGKVFDKFQQLENPVKSEEKGSGLGLALVREIVEHHGGKVGVESEPGRGASFYFLLPVIE